jgi:hypothetical protein
MAVIETYYEKRPPKDWQEKLKPTIHRLPNARRLFQQCPQACAPVAVDRSLAFAEFRTQEVRS